MEIQTIPVHLLKRGRYQPRKEMDKQHIDAIAQSLSESGQQEPLLVKKNEDGTFEIDSGEYRSLAAKQLGWPTLKAIVCKDNAKVRAITAIVTNRNKALNPIEEAQSFARLKDEFGLTHDQIAKTCGLGKQRTYVSKSIALLKLPLIVRQLLEKNNLQSTHGHLLLKVDEALRVDLAKEVAQKNLTTRELEKRIAAYDQSTNKGRGRNLDVRTQDWVELENYLSQSTGLTTGIKVSGSKKRKTYHIELSCTEQEVFEQLLKQLEHINLKNGDKNDEHNDKS